MLVGDCFSGKTTCYKVLADAINRLRQLKDVYFYTQVDTFLLNPKSMTIEQLYGFTDAGLNWTDGVLSDLARRLAGDTSPIKKWIILDGPGIVCALSQFIVAVDSLWIESMNTVMDQNKMLFLTNGERIPIPSQMRFIFEVPDLDAATPGLLSIMSC